MITVALAACAIVGVGAEENETTEPEVVRFVGLPNAPTAVQAISEDATKGDNIKLDWPSPFTNALAWSDGKLPHYGPTYIAGMTNGANSVLWTPFVTTKTVFGQFKTFILETGCTLCLRHKPTAGVGFVFNDLKIEGSPEIWLGNNGGGTALEGKITLADGAILGMRGRQDRNFEVRSELHGRGKVKFFPQTGTTTEYGTTYYLRGINTNFHGKVAVNSKGKNTKGVHILDKVSRIAVTNEFNLGGNLESFTCDALSLARYSMLAYGEASELVLSASSNRGLVIGVYGAQISVSDPSGRLIVNWPITVYSSENYPSVLYKEGRGRLVLGNALRFTSVVDPTAVDSVDSKEYPVSEHPFNFTVKKGSLEVTHCDALNGAKIAFSNNTEMVMSVDVQDDDFKRYGVKFTKTTSAPFATDVPVRLVASEGGNLTEASYSKALFTVNEADAEDVADKLSVELDINNYKLGSVRYAVNEKKNEEDPVTVTFYADILHNGLVISVR